jgi:hypothetical protein
MKAQARHIHVLRRFGGIQCQQNTPKAVQVLNAEFGRVSSLSKLPQALVPERADHGPM